MPGKGSAAEGSNAAGSRLRTARVQAAGLQVAGRECFCRLQRVQRWLSTGIRLRWRAHMCTFAFQICTRALQGRISSTCAKYGYTASLTGVCVGRECTHTSPFKSAQHRCKEVFSARALSAGMPPCWRACLSDHFRPPNQPSSGARTYFMRLR